MRALWSSIAVVVAGCAFPPDGPQSAPARPETGAWHYDVTLSEDLARMDVELRFAGAVPRGLSLGDDDGLPYVTDVAAVEGERRTPLRPEGRVFVLDEVAGATAVAYRVDFARLVSDGPGNRVGRDRCASPGLWLLRPTRLPDAPRATLALHLPRDVAATLPWPRRGDLHELDESAFVWRGFAAFGPMEQHAVETAGARLEVSILDFPRAASWLGLQRWLTRAARAAADLYGTFPVPRAQVVLRPVVSNDAVAFGETQRGGGPAVLFRIGSEAADAAFERDWVAVHEFVHHGMPAIADADAWLSEGFVQYYTEVLRGRAGILDERGAWGEMVAGFGRGRRGGAGSTLAADSAAMQRTHAYMRVYWAGAAIALLCDVELRRSSGNTRSLDDAMREVRRAFTGTSDARAREVTAREILTHLDRWLGRELFSSTSARHLASREFPDVGPLLDELGVVVRDGRIARLDDGAPLAALRRAIILPP